MSGSLTPRSRAPRATWSTLVIGLLAVGLSGCWIGTPVTHREKEPEVPAAAQGKEKRELLEKLGRPIGTKGTESAKH